MSSGPVVESLDFPRATSSSFTVRDLLYLYEFCDVKFIDVFSLSLLNFLNSSVSAISFFEEAVPAGVFKNLAGELACFPDIFLIMFHVCLTLVLVLSFET